MLDPQPKPQAKGYPVYPVLLDYVQTKYGKDSELASLVTDRYWQGMERYGQPLMTDDGRDTESDLAQELMDALYYTQKGIMQGRKWQDILCVLSGLLDSFVNS